ncbi:hypothetical protein GRI62_10940 [Erythrobacter arachoides]|uniref:Uncharacterized protein n=1 Tax=Aurantiacibacter arachoides TaxID=1850444 RepID=A0A845A0Q2_9SPHN|nr:hypothetical protein [Aurantiacibacter arachoides]MXO94111.1 hypothetical protein [Aurantiacibacter arachoides]GGD65960.1 hypothetical protein GCM10011411_27980 [Aurantiacibacter arachoides]
MTEKAHIDYGALVGWTSSWVDGRLALRVQSVTKPPPHDKQDVHTHVYLMDRNQAAQLANFLFEMGDHSKPDTGGRKLLKRLFG